MIDSRTWWITGGFSGEQIYNSTEVYEPGVGFREGPKMPAVTFQHCIVKVNATYVFSAGGYPYNRLVAKNPSEHIPQKLLHHGICSKERLADGLLQREVEQPEAHDAPQVSERHSFS